MVVKKWKAMFGRKNCNILSSLPPSLKNLYLRQLKNNQNQRNTTGAQNVKEFYSTTGWLSGLVNLKPTSPSPTDLKIKKTFAVIW